MSNSNNNSCRPDSGTVSVIPMRARWSPGNHEKSKFPENKFLTINDLAYPGKFSPSRKTDYQYENQADILLRGYIGWNSRRALQVVNHVFPKDAAVQPDLVIVYFGGNDSMGSHPSGLGPHVPLTEYIENMRKIAVHLQGLSDKTRILFLTCPPVNEDQLRKSTSNIFSELKRSNELCGRYSDACVELCRDLGVKVIDLWTAFQKKENWMNSCFTDGVHLSSEGSTIVVDEILKALEEAEWEPSLHWKSLPTEFAEGSPFDLVLANGKETINPSEWTFHRGKWH